MEFEEIKINKEKGETILTGFDRILMDKFNNIEARLDYEGLIVTTDMIPNNYRVLPKSQIFEIMKENAIAALDREENKKTK